MSRSDQFAPLLEQISSCTTLFVSLDGVYNWVTLLPSKWDSRILVRNRRFRCFQSDRSKCWGLRLAEATQLELLDLLSGCTSPEQIQQLLPAAENLVEKKASQLRKRQVPLDQLVVRQRISRDLSGYKSPPPAARALMQLNSVGKTKKPGQSIKFLFVNSKDGVFAWDLPLKASPEMISVIVYEKLLRRAANSILSPFIKTTLPLFEYPISRK